MMKYILPWRDVSICIGFVEKMNNDLKYELIATALREEFRALPSGSRLASVRKLMSRFGVSQATIGKTLDHLVQTGAIVHVAGKGYFVSGEPPRERALKYVDLCFFYEPESLLSNPLFSLETSELMHLSHQHGIQLNIYSVDQANGGVPVFKQRVVRTQAQAAILMCSKNINYELALRDMGVPAFLLSPNAIIEDSCFTRINNDKAIRLLVEHLVGVGQERIALLHGQGFRGFYHQDQEIRIDAFYKCMRAAGKQVPEEFVQYGGFDNDAGYEAAKKLLGMKRPPTAIMANDYNAQGVYRAIAEKGLSVGGDILVTGFDNMSSCELLQPPLTTIDIQPRNIARIAMESVIALHAGRMNSGTRIYSDVLLVKRASTGFSTPAAP